jgi:predicted Fe-S protein YdhL (DUF1289 family)
MSSLEPFDANGRVAWQAKDRSCDQATQGANLMIASPCIGLCRIDEKSGLCLGCARSRVEIAMWRQSPDDELLRILARLPDRRNRLGLGIYNLGWNVEEIRSFVIKTFRPGSGAWVAGVHGAVAEFCIGEAEPYDSEVDTHTVRASSARGAIRFTLSEHIQALALGSASDAAGFEIVALAIPCDRATSFRDRGLMRVGPDREAIRDKHREEILYDFGLGRNGSGFGIRTPDGELKARLDRVLGLEWQQFLSAVGADLLRISPTRVVRNSIGRIEIFTAIPSPDGASASGPHTHFLPDHLKERRDLPANIRIPPGYISCAIFYPECAT